MNPELFQGAYKRRNYFEGWYYKQISKSREHVFGIIPGISYGSSPSDRHAFIQLINAVTHKTYYFSFPMADFQYDKHAFFIKLKDNVFHREGIQLHLKNNDLFISGELLFKDIIPFPKTILNPGIMGPYSFIPFMECHHGIVNIHHHIHGHLTIDRETIDMSGGYGYIEKDWGKSFPEAWIWLQSNHFEQGDISVMFSIAKIPWLHKHFIGFISFLRIGQKLYRFATYTKAKLRKLEFKNSFLSITIQDSNYTLRLRATYNKGGLLKAPKDGLMNREITESITSLVQVELYDKNNKLLFHGDGQNTGMEIGGDINILTSLSLHR